MSGEGDSRQPGKFDPASFDPWARPAGGGLRWMLVSAAVHAGLLALFATVSITVIQTIEKIRVKVIEEPLVGEEIEGAPSLEDLAGLLDVAPAPRRVAAVRAPRVQNVRAPAMPKIGGLGPKLGRGPEIDTGAAPLSFGAGAIGGLGGSFGDYVGGLRKVGLDLALVIDTTESMQFVIDEVKQSLTRMVTAIQRMVPTSRVGIVVYRDQGDEYVVRWTDLSFRTDKLRDFLANITASGGGDWEEAVLEALDTAIHELTWRKRSKKIVILVGGSPPHADEMPELREVVRSFRESGGYLSAIDVTDHLHLEFERKMWRSLHGRDAFRPSPKPEFYREVTEVYRSLAADGGGELVQLADEKKLLRDILVLTFGSRWKVEMARYLKDLS